jgi:hypothetical protein
MQTGTQSNRRENARRSDLSALMLVPDLRRGLLEVDVFAGRCYSHALVICREFLVIVARLFQR